MPEHQNILTPIFRRIDLSDDVSENTKNFLEAVPPKHRIHVGRQLNVQLGVEAVDLGGSELEKVELPSNAIKVAFVSYIECNADFIPEKFGKQLVVYTGFIDGVHFHMEPKGNMTGFCVEPEQYKKVDPGAFRSTPGAVRASYALHDGFVTYGRKTKKNIDMDLIVPEAAVNILAEMAKAAFDEYYKNLEANLVATYGI